MSSIVDNVEYDSETSSDDEYDGSKYPYGMIKKGREYIEIWTHYPMLVPSIEFEKIYGDVLQKLRDGCKDITTKADTKIYKFGMKSYYRNTQEDPNNPDSPEISHTDEDKEFYGILQDFVDKISSYADDAPHHCGCAEKDKSWYKESICNSAYWSLRNLDSSIYDSPYENVKELDCTIKESFELTDWD